MKSFKDYINNRQISEADMEVVKNPKVKLVADYDGPTATAPDQGKSSVSYAPANKPMDPNKGKGESGFADLGAKDLVYNPVTKGGDSKTTALGTVIKNKEALGEGTFNYIRSPKLKSEAWFNKTKKMTTQDFIKECIVNVNSEGMPRLSVNEDGQAFPAEVIRYVSRLSQQNPKNVSSFVHQMKRDGNLSKLIEAILEHPESLEVIGTLLSESEVKCRMLANSMYDEAVGPPLGMHNGDDDFSSKLKGQDDDDHHDNDDDDSDHSDEDDDEPHDEFGDDDDDSDDHDDDDDDDNPHNHDDDDDSNGFGDDDKGNGDDDETFDNHDDEDNPFGKHEEFKRLFRKLNN